jgi:hypothetical protein
MVVEFITACAISAYHHKGCEFEPLLIQTYVIKFVSDLQEVCGFLRFPPSIKTTDITYIIQLYKYYTIHFLCGKCGVILIRQTNIDRCYIIYQFFMTNTQN